MKKIMFEGYQMDLITGVILLFICFITVYFLRGVGEELKYIKHKLSEMELEVQQTQFKEKGSDRYVSKRRNNRIVIYDTLKGDINSPMNNGFIYINIFEHKNEKEANNIASNILTLLNATDTLSKDIEENGIDWGEFYGN